MPKHEDYDKEYVVTFISKNLILFEFEDDDDFEQIEKKVAAMTDADMKKLAANLCDEFLDEDLYELMHNML